MALEFDTVTTNLPDEDERPRTVLGVEWTGIAKVAVLVATIVVGVFIWACVDALNPPADTTAPVLATGGFLLTGGALAVAMLIFQVQRQDSRDQASTASTQLAAVRDQLLEGMAHAHTPADIESDLAIVANSEKDDAGEGRSQEVSSTTDSATAALLSERLRELGVPEEKLAEIEPFKGSDIPLRPLAILRNGLVDNPAYARVVDGHPDQIKPNDLAAYRRTNVQGPSTWFLVVPTAPGSGRGAKDRRGRSIWKVSLLTEQIERIDVAA